MQTSVETLNGAKVLKKLKDLHKKGVQINFMCYDIS